MIYIYNMMCMYVQRWRYCQQCMKWKLFNCLIIPCILMIVTRVAVSWLRHVSQRRWTVGRWCTFMSLATVIAPTWIKKSRSFQLNLQMFPQVQPFWVTCLKQIQQSQQLFLFAGIQLDSNPRRQIKPTTHCPCRSPALWPSLGISTQLWSDGILMVESRA